MTGRMKAIRPYKWEPAFGRVTNPSETRRTLSVLDTLVSIAALLPEPQVCGERLGYLQIGVQLPLVISLGGDQVVVVEVSPSNHCVVH